MKVPDVACPNKMEKVLYSFVCQKLSNLNYFILVCSALENSLYFIAVNLGITTIKQPSGKG